MSSRPPRDFDPNMLCPTPEGATATDSPGGGCDGPAGVLLCYKPENLPDFDTLQDLMAGFDEWGVMTADTPSDEMKARHIGSEMMCYVEDEITTYGTDGALTGAFGAGGAIMPTLGPWPYVYRAMHRTDDPNMGLNPNNWPGRNAVGGRPLPLLPPDSDVAMTGRHIGHRGEAHGTNRISVSESAMSARQYMLTSKDNTRLVRIDPRGLDYLPASEISRHVELRIAELEGMLGGPYSRTERDRIQAELADLKRHRTLRLAAFQEGHIFGQPQGGTPVIARERITPLYDLGAPTAAQRVRTYHDIGQQEFRNFLGTHRTTVRVSGGILMIIGAIGTTARIMGASPDMRNRVISQEAWIWAGGLVGSWGGVKAGVAIGAAVGTAVPLIGTAAGAIVGGLIGMFVGGAIGGWIGATGADYVYAKVVDDIGSRAALGHPIGAGSYDLNYRY